MLVVARDAVDLWDQLSREFAGTSLRIILDRRRDNDHTAGDGRRPERRRRPEVDDEMRRRGFAAVPVGSPGVAASEPAPGRPTRVSA